MTGRIDVLPAAAHQAPVLANLLELYAHDFSEIAGFELGEDGRFGYPHLPLYWTAEGRHPFLVRVDGRLAGFVLVARGSRTGGGAEVWDMAEFFVARRYRRRGIGAAVAREVWGRFPGRWEVRVMEAHEAARAFWAGAIRGFAGAPPEETALETGGRRWRAYAFTAPG